MDTARKTFSSQEFLAWVATQDKGKFELWQGEVVAMSPERRIHVRIKSRTGFILQNALDTAGLDCAVMIDGLAVVIDQETTFEPDILVECGSPSDDNGVVSHNPIIVVEVLSPGTRHIDKTAKLNAYAQILSISHYLIIDPDKRVVVRHRREGENRFATTLLRAGRLRLEPPGIEVTVEHLLPE